MKSSIAAVASAWLMCLSLPAFAADEPMKKDAMAKEGAGKGAPSHDEIMKKCADKTGMSKDDLALCDAMMKDMRKGAATKAGETKK